MKDNKVINKSMFLMAARCIKSVYLDKYRPDLRIDNINYDIVQRKKQETASIAIKLLDSGIDIAGQRVLSFDEYVKQTGIKIKEGYRILYQACFESESKKRAKVDILTITHQKMEIYLIKNKTSIDDEDILEITFNTKVIQECFPKYKTKSYIIHLNKSYVKQGDLDPESLFVKVDVSFKIKSAEPLFAKHIGSLKKVTQMSRIPEKSIGVHCEVPNECPFKSYCCKSLPHTSVFDLVRMRKEFKYELYERGIVKLQDLPKNIRLTDKQQIQVECAITNRCIVDVKLIDAFLKDIEYPIFYLDFETIQPAIPLYDGMSPYQNIVFQYSLHKEHIDNKVQHFEFLHNGKGDPRLIFIQNLLEVLEEGGTIIVYNQRFEMGRLKELAIYYPEYGAKIMRVIDRMQDLMKPFEDRYLYHPEQKGSVSLKKVLPAWVPDLTYKGLNIGNGVSASEQYEKFIQPFTPL